MIKYIEKQIEKAWKMTGKEFLSDLNPKAVFWKEQASLKYPFYCNLKQLLEKLSISPKVELVPEYSSRIPADAECNNKDCFCMNRQRPKNALHIDLCLVRFDKEIRRSDIKCQDGYRNMWCFEPQPIVAMEFKYYYYFEKQSVNKDIEKLLEMEKMYKTQLLYFCFATYNNKYIDQTRECFKKALVGKSPLVKEKFRLSIGTLQEDEWGISSIK